ncbi:MAG: protein-L-isoaspartate O-methyltransferase [Gammaproteobacteria bacterium]|nr:protein-L-isoaspartate O-methyltransferase [Gammaproteobacteria bacterium]
MNRNQARENMIEQQIRPWDVLDQRVLNALADIPRENFVGDAYRDLAYSDTQLPIGHDQKMLNPNVDGRILQALAVNTTDSVLEIGTGSGYLANCLSRLAGSVTTLEIIPELHTAASARLEQAGCSNTRCILQDAAVSWDAADAYDAIAFSGSVQQIPDFYRQKVAINGRLFVVVGSQDNPTMEAQLHTRVSASEWISESLFETQVPPLQNFATESETFAF